MPTTTLGLVLVVSADGEALTLRGRALEDAGFEVTRARTGEEGLRIARDRTPRVAVLDVELPDFDGRELCRRLRDDSRTAAIAVLYIAPRGGSERGPAPEGDDCPDACLDEPVDPSVVVATVRALVRQRRAEDALRDALAGERTARAAAEAASRLKDEFVASLSHELRSPIGTVLTWVTMLQTNPSDAALRAQALDAIERNTRQQVRLIEDLLDVSRIISGKLRLSVGPVSLPLVVEAALESIRPAATAKAIGLDVSIEPTAGPVTGDSARLQQVLWNLLQNAVKFTPKGGRVAVVISNVASSTEVRVSDTGQGIEPSFLPHVFERFRQADSSTTRVQSGLGLGLAIVRHLVELHGGSVGAESAGLGHGTTFTLRLPIAAVRPAAAARPAATAAATAPGDVGPRLDGLGVLVVEDTDDAREAIAAVLAGRGAQVTAVASAREALVALANAPFDLVVSDIAMPERDGFRFIRDLRTRFEAPTRRIPVIALTAYASPDERRRILAAGFDAHVAKPVDAQRLVEAVASLKPTPPPRAPVPDHAPAG